MSQDVCPLVSADDRVRLEAIIADRNRPQKHVARARIILGSADRLIVAEIARLSGVSRPSVWRWQRRFGEAGVDGLLREGSKKPGKPPMPDADVQRLIALTCSEPPGEVTHWTGRAMAKAAGISLRLGAADLGANMICSPIGSRRSSVPTTRPLPRSCAPSSVSMSSRRRTAWSSRVDEKSQIQALDRTQPGLPIKPGKCGTMTHDYKRNGTTTLFAALNVLDGTVIGRCMQKHRHQGVHSLSQYHRARRCQPAR